MTDRQKRARLREIFADSKGAIAPGVTDPVFARSVDGLVLFVGEAIASYVDDQVPPVARLAGKTFSARWFDLTGR
jgi:hypothetical protein